MYKRILVPVDGSDTSDQALVAALDLARKSNGRVRILHALDELTSLDTDEYSSHALQYARQGAQKTADNAMAIASSAGVPADSKLLEQAGLRLGDLVADEARAWEADLVVVGTHGRRRGIGRALLGRGAEQVIRMAPVPVLAIRAPEVR